MNQFSMRLIILCVVFSEVLCATNFHSDCGQIFTQKQFLIESPLYPSSYPLNYQCLYLLKGPTCPTNFTFQFLDFNLELSEGCAKDRLEIDNLDALCGRKSEPRQYFAEKGALTLKFVSDSFTTGSGFKILVTRSSCNSLVPIPTEVPKWHTTNRNVENAPTTPKPSAQRCCQTAFGGRRFLLTSPNFPYTMASPTECQYEIYRANHNICRLKLQIKFFWLGHNTSCSTGFLEIDGKYICGCMSDVKIISSFEHQPVKLLRFVSRAYEQQSYSGFVIEVFQEDCPKKYTPAELHKNVSSFDIHNDQINRISWPNHSHKTVGEKIKHIDENTELIVNEPAELVPNQAQIVRHFYFFTAPESFARRDIEETDFIDTAHVGTWIVKDKQDYAACINWNRLQLSYLFSANFPKCKMPVKSAIEDNDNCVEFNHLRGFFKSPGYPFYYPGNLNVCYRFRRQNGYCGIRFHIKDFYLQHSPNCQSDYLIFGQYRYCGGALCNTMTTVDLSSRSYEDIRFVTDSLYCGRGFFAVYEQIPCENQYPMTSTNPPPVFTPTVPNLIPCNRVIKDEKFSLEVFDYNEMTCTFEIQKVSDYVCAINLDFEEFNLNCEVESLVIDGAPYCRNIKNHHVKIDVVNKNSTSVSYTRLYTNTSGGSRFRITGTQELDDCAYPEVPAALVSQKSEGLTKNKFFVKIDKRFRDVCGIISNITEIKLPGSFCDFIMQNNNITECLPLTQNSLIIPLEMEKLELKIRNTSVTQEVEFEEIDCDRISK